MNNQSNVKNVSYFNSLVVMLTFLFLEIRIDKIVPHAEQSNTDLK